MEAYWGDPPVADPFLCVGTSVRICEYTSASARCASKVRKERRRPSRSKPHRSSTRIEARLLGSTQASTRARPAASSPGGQQLHGPRGVAVAARRRDQPVPETGHARLWSQQQHDAPQRDVVLRACNRQRPSLPPPRTGMLPIDERQPSSRLYSPGTVVPRDATLVTAGFTQARSVVAHLRSRTTPSAKSGSGSLSSIPSRPVPTSGQSSVASPPVEVGDYFAVEPRLRNGFRREARFSQDLSCTRDNIAWVNEGLPEHPDKRRAQITEGDGERPGARRPNGGWAAPAKRLDVGCRAALRP